MSPSPADGFNLIIFWCVIVPLAAGAYLLPFLIAARRDHPQAVAIFVLNLLLGWSGLGWIAALIWACTAIDRRARS